MKEDSHRFYRKRVLLSFVFMAMVQILTGQKFAFEQITTLDGLAENYINSIYQDNDGFIWLGTHDGLCRYDGLEFRNYNIDIENKNWIHSNQIRYISGDEEGNLWIVSADKGIYRYNKSRNSFSYIGFPQLLSSLQPNDLVFSYRMGNELLVGTVNGLYIIPVDEHLNITTGCSKLKDIPQVYHMLINKSDGNDIAWIGTENGMFKYWIDEEGIRQLKHYPKSGSGDINHLVRYEEDFLIASNDGIFHFDELEGYQQINPIVASELLLDNEGSLWASNGEGLIILNPNDSAKMDFTVSMSVEEGWEMENISSNLITKLFLDRTDNVWICTQNGVNRFNPNRKRFAHYRRSSLKGSISSNSIRSIFEDDQANIWIGTNGKGINFLAGSKAKIKEYNSFVHYTVKKNGSPNDAYCIERVLFKNQTYYLIGTSPPEAIAFYQLENDLPVRRYPFFSSDIFNWGVFDISDDEQYIWIGGIFDGLFRYDKKLDVMTHFSVEEGHTISSNIVRDILVDREGNLWVATGDGLNYLPATEKGNPNPVFSVFHHTPGDTTSLAHHYILTLYEDSDGDIWIGTMGGGLNKYLGHGRFATINHLDGLPNNVIKGMLEDDDRNLWISTNKGLSKLDHFSMEISNFDLYDGLQDFEFGEHACARLSDGEMLFGGARGITAFYPEEIKKEVTLPELVFTELQILNRTVEVGQKITGRVVLDRVINETAQIRLKHSENSFSITFAGLHYSAPAKISYQYMLDGFNQEWVKTTSNNNFAKYTNLPPGRYTFKVMASNNDGVWNPIPKTIDLRVIPPFWYTWPAIMVYILIFIGTILFFRQYTFITTREKQALLMEQFEQEKIRELSQMKLRFYTNISHEFRTPLTLIMGPVKRMMQQYNSLTPEKSKQLLQTIYRNSGMLLRLINQLMDFRKLEQDKMELNATEGNLYLTAKEIFESFEEMAFQKQIGYTFWSHSRKIPIWYDYEKIEKILYNLLSNAFKYTPKDGTINFMIHDYDEQFVEIRIEDSGIGIPESDREHIFKRFYRSKSIVDKEHGSTGIGLSLTKGLVELHKGAIDFNSIPGAGSAFYVRLRKGESHLDENEKSKDEASLHRSVFNQEALKSEVTAENLTSISTNGSGNKILIVEDNIDLRNFLKDCFDSQHGVYTAEDGVVALDMVKYLEPDIIISDIMMPQMDGLELCKRIKENELTSHIPVILLTARNTEDSHIEGYNVGADAYIGKPFDAGILIAQVRSILKRMHNNRKRFKEKIEVTPSEVAMTAMDEKFLKRSFKLIEENIVDPNYSVVRLASDYGMSQKLMNKKLKVLTGLTAKSFIRSIKMKRAAQLLKTGRYTVSEVTYDVGFSDLKYFRSCFKEEFGITPSDYKKSYSSEAEVSN